MLPPPPLLSQQIRPRKRIPINGWIVHRLGRSRQRRRCGCGIRIVIAGWRGVSIGRQAYEKRFPALRGDRNNKEEDKKENDGVEESHKNCPLRGCKIQGSLCEG
jgi:hypothetical protein